MVRIEKMEEELGDSTLEKFSSPHVFHVKYKKFEILLAVERKFIGKRFEVYT